MARLILPVFIGSIYSSQLNKRIPTYNIVPNGVLPMDCYNALSQTPLQPDIRHGWVDAEGKMFNSQDAANHAFEVGLVDERYDNLDVFKYRGRWKER